jgi:CRISPR/Cas system-associated protein Csx1
VKRCGDVKEYIASDPKRNFFAHSGLIKDFIEAKRNDEINVRYMDKPEITNQISSWINNPEK